MVKAVVFDLDDTLISERQYIESGFKVVSKFIGDKYNLDNDIVFECMNMLFEESSKEVFNRVLDSFKIKYSKEELLYLIKVYREHTPEIEFFDDVIPTLEMLREKGMKLGIITDGYKETQSRKIEVLKCKELFDEIIITDEFGREFWKPHEKSYKSIAERLGVKLNEMIYVGDNVAKDFVTANELGIATINVNRKSGMYKINRVDRKFLAKYKLNNISDIFDMLFNTI
ncbi:HAD family hydrolase [Clostridium disporicum]|uniref:Putative hydrolase n=1 Tax=Clostridium disporicum TaxID=84024 RepID=A0A174GVS6_9CLOT|nr:HAD-IA family hydrolase [Clostridium disporicum]CUO64635.1 putative hydrolase [Clostridium disporicum]